MMSMTAMDKQFIDDNMLTDEDFLFDAGDEFEVSYEEKNILESIANDLQRINNGTLPAVDSEHAQNSSNICTDLNDFIKNMYDIEFKIEPASPNSSDVSPDKYSSDKEVSVITIPELSDCETAILADTPPPTPCEVMDILPDSPTNCSVEPVIVSVKSITGLPYSISPNSQTVITPVNYRVNIQPKIESKTKVTKPAALQTIIPKSGHKTVLTPEQMDKLARGTLQLRPPPNVSSSVSKGIQNGKQSSNGLISKTISNGVVNKAASKINTTKKSTLNALEICAAALKRQERIIKNRESAYLSRKRRKEYVQKLELELNQMSAENSSLREENARLKNMTVENSSLREENCRLKNKITDLEREMQKLQAAFSSKATKKTICFMVVLFMLTFNLTPYSSVFQQSGPDLTKSDIPTRRIGRILLWDEGNSTMERKNETKSLYHKLGHLPDDVESTYIVDFDKSYNSSSCQNFINKTESLRLESDLLGWVERVEKKQKQTKLTKQKFHMEKALPHLASLSRRRAESNKDIWARKKNRNEILIYETPRKAYEDFFDAIHRRDDTFYFVSFSGDHLLLPAIAHNKTLRPRMSFVMPAMTLNESVEDSSDHISMMQIDCEVMDTKLVYIKESVIPEHLRQKHNSTSKHHSRNSNFRDTKRLQSENKLPPK